MSIHDVSIPHFLQSMPWKQWRDKPNGASSYIALSMARPSVDVYILLYSLFLFFSYNLHMAQAIFVKRAMLEIL